MQNYLNGRILINTALLWVFLWLRRFTMYIIGEAALHIFCLFVYN